MQIAILDIMGKCLGQAWERAKEKQNPQDASKVSFPHFRNIQTFRQDYISDSLATKMHSVTLPFLLKAPQVKGSEDLPVITQKAGKVLFHASALNADAVFPKVASIVEKVRIQYNAILYQCFLGSRNERQ